MQLHLLCVERACDYCGARLEITAAETGGARRLQPFVCPQCTKTHSIECAGNPHVRVLKPRSDGKSGSYQQTMF